MDFKKGDAVKCDVFPNSFCTIVGPGGKEGSYKIKVPGEKGTKIVKGDRLKKDKRKRVSESMESVKNKDIGQFEKTFEQDLQEKIAARIEDRKMQIASNLLDEAVKLSADVVATQKLFEQVSKNVDGIVKQLKATYGKGYNFENSFNFKKGIFDTNAVGYGYTIDFKKGTISGNAGLGGRNLSSLMGEEGTEQLEKVVDNLMSNNPEAGPVISFESKGGDVSGHIEFDFINLVRNKATGLVIAENYDDGEQLIDEDFKNIRQLIDVFAGIDSAII